MRGSRYDSPPTSDLRDLGLYNCWGARLHPNSNAEAMSENEAVPLNCDHSFHPAQEDSIGETAVRVAERNRLAEG
jgi:hypothetical protein